MHNYRVHYTCMDKPCTGWLVVKAPNGYIARHKLWEKIGWRTKITLVTPL